MIVLSAFQSTYSYTWITVVLESGTVPVKYAKLRWFALHPPQRKIPCALQ